MGLTRITSDGIADGAIAGSDLADQSVTLAKLPHGTSSNDGKFLQANNGADPTFETVNTDLVSDTSPQLGGNLDTNDKNIVFGDSSGSTVNRLTFGAGTDLSIRHDGTDTIFSNATGDLYINNAGTNSDDIILSAKDDVQIKVQDGEFAINCFGDGGVEIFHNNSKKLQTQSGGVRVFGDLENHNDDFIAKDNCKFAAGNSEDLQIYHNGSNSFISNSTGGLFVRGNTIKLRDAAGNEDYIEAFQNGSVRLYHDNSLKFETQTNGVTVQGGVYSGGLILGDNDEIEIGNSADLKIFHNGTNSFIQDAGTGGLAVITSDFAVNNAADTEQMIRAIENAGVELFYNGSKKFETSSTGTTTTGVSSTTSLSINSSSGYVGLPDNAKIFVGTNNDIQIYHDSSANKSKIETTAGGNLDIGSTHNADVQIKTNSVNRFNFGAGGFAPLANNTYELGTSSLRWSNIYTNDLNLSNEGGSNDVDGTWGSFTIQEGAEDLFLVNKRNGKKFKFLLEEVS